jgi:hypothetical protein
VYLLLSLLLVLGGYMAGSTSSSGLDFGTQTPVNFSQDTSQTYQPVNNPAALPIYSQPQSGQVLGGQTQTPPPGGNNPPAGNPPAPNPTTGVDPHINPTTGQWDDNYYASTHSGGAGGAPDMGAVNAAYDQAMQAFNAAIPMYQQMFGTAQTGIQNWQSAQESNQNLSAQQQNQTLNESNAQQDTSAQNAMQQARQMQAEIQQGLQSRYGGTTGTGQFAGELSGRQSMQDIGKIQQGLQQAHLEIGNRLQQVQAVTQAALKQIGESAQQQMKQAQDTLAQEINSVQQNQSMLQVDKAKNAMSAMQNYQASINQINEFNATQQQQLQMQQSDLTNKLQVAQTYLQSYTGNNMPANQTAPTTGAGVVSPVNNNAVSNAGQTQAGGQTTSTDPNWYNSLLNSLGWNNNQNTQTTGGGASY